MTDKQERVRVSLYSSPWSLFLSSPLYGYSVLLHFPTPLCLDHFISELHKDCLCFIPYFAIRRFWLHVQDCFYLMISKMKLFVGVCVSPCEVFISTIMLCYVFFMIKFFKYTPTVRRPWCIVVVSWYMDICVRSSWVSITLHFTIYQNVGWLVISVKSWIRCIHLTSQPSMKTRTCSDANNR